MLRTPHPMFRPILAALALLLTATAPGCGVFGLSAEEREVLATYQRRAKYYYEGGNFDQSLYMVEQGLEVEPTDYNLRWIRAMVYLRTSTARPGNLEQAETYFEDLFPERAVDNHVPRFLLGYAWLSQKLAMRELREAERLRIALDARAEADFETHASRARLAEHDNRAGALLQRTKNILDHLVAKGEEVLQAEHTLMQVYATMGDLDRAVAHGERYLVAAQKEEQRILEAIRSPQTSVDGERAHQVLLREHRANVLRAKEYLAALDFQREEYAATVARLDEIVRMEPHRADHYYNRAEALQRLGERSRAREDFQTFLVKTDLAEGNEKVRRARKAVLEMSS